MDREGSDVFQCLNDALSQGKFDSIGSMLDVKEVEAAARGSPVLDNWPYDIHLLGHLMVNDMNSARFLWKRIPDAAKANNPSILAVWKIGQCLWNRDYKGVHGALRGHNWEDYPQLQPLIARLSQLLLDRTFKLLSCGYSVMAASEAAAFLGMASTEEVVAFTTARGWEYNPSDQTLKVNSLVTHPGNQDVHNLQKLAEYVVHLEN
eukprot:jgi/Mesvir1/24744/Mv22006-RA.1